MCDYRYSTINYLLTQLKYPQSLKYPQYFESNKEKQFKR